MIKNNNQSAFENALNIMWDDVFSDPGTEDWTTRWFLDGNIASVSNRDDGMMVSARPKREDEHHLVVWTNEEFSGDLKIEFDYIRCRKKLLFSLGQYIISGHSLGKDRLSLHFTRSAIYKNFKISSSAS